MCMMCDDDSFIERSIVLSQVSKSPAKKECILFFICCSFYSSWLFSISGAFFCLSHKGSLFLCASTLTNSPDTSEGDNRLNYPKAIAVVTISGLIAVCKFDSFLGPVDTSSF